MKVRTATPTEQNRTDTPGGQRARERRLEAVDPWGTLIPEPSPSAGWRATYGAMCVAQPELVDHAKILGRQRGGT
mgnify:CR=1 FL=1